MEAGLPPDSVEVDGSAFKSFVAYMEAAATSMGASILPNKMEIDGHSHGSRLTLPSTSTYFQWK